MMMLTGSLFLGAHFEANSLFQEAIIGSGAASYIPQSSYMAPRLRGPAWQLESMKRED
jgi:hypothetical protein